MKSELFNVSPGGILKENEDQVQGHLYMLPGKGVDWDPTCTYTTTHMNTTVDVDKDVFPCVKTAPTNCDQEGEISNWPN